MGSKTVIEPKIDYVSDALDLLIHIANKKDFLEDKNMLLKEYGGADAEQVNSYFDILIQMENGVRDKLYDLKLEQITKYYFGRDRRRGKNLGELVVLRDSYRTSYMPCVKQLGAELEGLDEADYCQRFGDMLVSYNETICEEQERTGFLQKMDVVQYLMQMKLKDEEKWEIQKIFLDPPTHRLQVFRLISLVTEEMRKFEKEILEITEAFRQYWSAMLAEPSYMEKLQENIGIVLDHNEYGMVLIPSVTAFDAVSIYTDSDKNNADKGPYCMRLGILLDQCIPLFSRKQDDAGQLEYALSVMKILSDKSKFEILMYLKKQSAYGSELAEYMGLSASTISHHTSALISAGLVRMEKRNTKVFYTINKSNLEAVLDYCREVFL